MFSETSQHSQPVEFAAAGQVNEVKFTADGKHLVGGCYEEVRVWRVKDGRQVARMQMKDSVRRVATSADGRWIAGASWAGEVFVWNAMINERVLAIKARKRTAMDVDFSPDSTRLISADEHSGTATIWDIEADQKLQSLDHDKVEAVKYSKQGERIATCGWASIRVWDSNDGRLLVVINDRCGVLPYYGLLWGNNHLFIIAQGNKMRQINSFIGSIISECSVPDTGYSLARTAMPQHERFVAYPSRNSITLWDTSTPTHTQLCLIPRNTRTRSIAFSPDDQLLAIATDDGGIVIKPLSAIAEPKIYISSVALVLWERGQLVSAEALLTEEISTSGNTPYHTLASRALVLARLRHWDAAIEDAKESINIRSSIVGYIAKCVALIGKGEILEGCRVCDLTSLYFQPDYGTILLLIKAVALFMAGERDDGISRVDNLIGAMFFNSSLYVVQAYMHLLYGNFHMEKGNYERAVQSFEDAQAKLGDRKDRPPLIILLISGWDFDNLALAIQQRYCEALHASRRIKEASECLLRMVNDEAQMTEPTMTWICDLMEKCLSAPESNEDAPREDTLSDVVPMSQETPYASYLVPLLREWVKLRATTSLKLALLPTSGFTLPKSIVLQVVCETLEMAGRIVDAVACFRHMRGKMTLNIDDEQVKWADDFLSRCRRNLEDLGDAAMSDRQYDEAISHYTHALSLDPTTSLDLLVKRSEAYAGKREWADALNDANEVIQLDPSSPLGYERKHEALCGSRHYVDAIHTFQTMLSVTSQASDPDIRGKYHLYVQPEQTRQIIRTMIKEVIRDSPPVLIDTTSGRLCSKSERATAFESMPAFTELVASMTTRIDQLRIEQVVRKFYDYATFSHTWEDNEPLFETVIEVVVYDLEESPEHDKLQMFCKIIREAGFNWAWSDTCCIDKRDHFVLQEALVSMFKWYEGSAMTIIFLRGVPRLALRGAMRRSKWNTRGWTLQEYHASRVVRFYTEAWTPYLGLDIHNHKESPEIMLEMEEATGISAQALMALRPGLDDIREKLRLASGRETARMEDAAYSLLGIFSISMPVVYGDGDRALGRFLAQVLTSSGDTSILAWTGRSGSFNTCLPASITVFNQLSTSHIPPSIPEAEMETTVTALRYSALSFTSATKLYDRLQELSAPTVSERRIKLPCLTFKLGRVLLSSQNTSGRVFRAQAKALGIVEIRTEEDITKLDSLYLIHPWIDILLDRQPLGNTATVDVDDTSSFLSDFPLVFGPSNVTSTAPQTRTARLIDRLGRKFGGRPHPHAALPSPPSSVSPAKKRLLVLQLIARLKQPFGALLLTPTRQHMEEFRRVATDSVITVQVEELTTTILDKLIQGVRVLDIL